jgi:hypothetical protein
MKNRNNAVATFVFAVAALAVTVSFAATEREYIWPDGKMPDAQAHQVGATTAEQRAP